MSHPIKYRCYGCGIMDICKCKDKPECAVYPISTREENVRKERGQNKHYKSTERNKKNDESIGIIDLMNKI